MASQRGQLDFIAVMGCECLSLHVNEELYIFLCVSTHLEKGLCVITEVVDSADLELSSLLCDLIA